MRCNRIKIMKGYLNSLMITGWSWSCVGGPHHRRIKQSGNCERPEGISLYYHVGRTNQENRPRHRPISHCPGDSREVLSSGYPHYHHISLPGCQIEETSNYFLSVIFISRHLGRDLLSSPHNGAATAIGLPDKILQVLPSKFRLRWFSFSSVPRVLQRTFTILIR